MLIALFMFLYPRDPRAGNMILFSVIFIGSFLLVAKFHHQQLTIILVASSISLILAYFLLEDIQSYGWSCVIGHYVAWEVLAVVCICARDYLKTR